MTANRARGEIAWELDGVERRFCLTLGALAELEAAYGVEDLGALVQRFSSGKLAAVDILRIVAAGLRGGGQPASEQEVAAMRCEGGAAGFAALVSALLAATFGGNSGSASANP